MEWHYKFSPALIVPSPAFITPRPANAFPNILAVNVPNNVYRSLSFYSFYSFLIASLIPFINNPDSLSNLTIFIISSISSFEIINAVVREAMSKGRPDL